MPYLLCLKHISVNSHPCSHSYSIFFSHRPDTTTQAMQSSMPAVWVKICSSWLGLALYLWTLLAPILLPNRDFS